MTMMCSSESSASLIFGKNISDNSSKCLLSWITSSNKNKIKTSSLSTDIDLCIHTHVMGICPWVLMLKDINCVAWWSGDAKVLHLQKKNSLNQGGGGGGRFLNMGGFP